MFISNLAALKKSWKGKKTEKEKDIVEVLKHASDRKKARGKNVKKLE